MLTLETFLAEIEAFLRRAKMAASAFGRAAVNDSDFVKDLRDGRSPSLKTVARVRDFIAAHEVTAKLMAEAAKPRRASSRRAGA